MRIFENGTIRDMTVEEIAAMQSSQLAAEIAERTRPLTESEVIRLLIARQINTLEVDGNMALRMTEFYPEWASGADYTAGFMTQRGGKLWRCLQSHRAQTGWEPENTPALWTEVCETYAGTQADPIPYEGNMALETGKYYIQDGAVYLCTRDTVNPVYGSLAELAGTYTELWA